METTSQSVRKDEEISHGARVGATSQQNMRRRKKKEDDDEERKEKKRKEKREKEREVTWVKTSLRPYQNDRVEGRRMIRNT